MKPVPIPPRVRRAVDLEEIALAGVRTLRIRPRDDSSQRSLLFFHGGGYVLCSPETHQDMLCRLALMSKAEIFAPDYRLAPENPYPAAVDDATAVYRQLLADGIAPEKLLVGGDSAGGGLSLAMLLRLREAGLSLPCGVVLISPWIDLTLASESVNDPDPSDYLTPGILKTFAGYYSGSTEPSHPELSPVFADLSGLPPFLVLVGGRERLRSEAQLLATRISETGGDCRLHVEPDAIHAYPDFPGLLPQALPGLRSIGQFIRTAAPGYSAPEG